jgi:hypothetical protein
MERARLVFAMAFLSTVHRNGEMAMEALANAFQQKPTVFRSAPPGFTDPGKDACLQALLCARKAHPLCAVAALRRLSPKRSNAHGATARSHDYQVNVTQPMGSYS